MPMPSFFGSGKGHSQNRLSSLSPAQNSSATPSRPTISAPLSSQSVLDSYSVQLVPIDKGAAELSNNNNNHYHHSDNNPSPPSTSSSHTTSTRKLLHRERNPGPPSPQPESTASSISRRISLRHHKPAPIQQQQQQQQHSDNGSLDPYLQHSPIRVSHSAGGSSRPQSMLPSPLETDTDTQYSFGSDHLAQQQQHYSQQQHQQQQQQQQYQEGYQQNQQGTVEQQQKQQHQQQQHQQQQHQQHQQHQHQHQHQQPPPQQQGYYEQPHPPQYQQDYQQTNSQHQQDQRGALMTPVQQNNAPRRSTDAPHQTGPPSREVSGLGQQGYSGQGAHQNNRGTEQQSYQNQGGASGAGNNGQPQLPYDPAKFEGQQGRMTPEKSGADSRSDARAAQAPEAINVPQLIQEHETLQGKYRKVKNLYFESKSEIERLQNTLAHQRLSQSRTSLDDNEYVSRFERLDGAIKNVAFEIRQSWKTIPAWLVSVINTGAELKGGREMTVVGRASISRWVVDEILEQFFHPALDINLSTQLKIIEQGIRKNTPLPQSIEEDDALSTRVCNWRLTTLDALQGVINGKQAADVKTRLAEHLVKKLVESLQQHLHEPAPMGLLGGVQMIVDIAIGLAANLPLESREVKVWYPHPGERFDTKFMRPETGIPPLVASAAQKATGDGEGKEDALGDGETQVPPLLPAKDDPKPMPSSRAGIGGLPPQSPPQQNPKEPAGKKPGGFSRVKKALQGGGITSPPPSSPNMPPQIQQNGPGAAGSQVSLAQTPSAPEAPKNEKVRVAGFMAVEVRGRSILVKAPVWI